MKRFSALLAAADTLIGKVLRTVSVAFFVVLTIILSLNIVNRFLPFTSFHWLDEIVELCFAGLVFYGAAAVWMTSGHFSAGDWISKRLGKPALAGAYRLVVELLSLVFVAVLLKYSWQITARSQEATAVFQIPKAVLYSCMPISAAVMVLYSILRVIAEIGALFAPARDGKED